MMADILLSLLFWACAFGVGVGTGWLIWGPTSRRGALPPATRKQLARERRANRADLRVLRGGDQRRWISPASGDFDEGDMQ